MTSGSSSMARMILSDSGGLRLSSGEGDGGNACAQGGSVIVQGERHGEGRAHPNGTLHGDISAQELGEATANRQAQARAAVLPGGAAIHLTKFFKDML